MLEVVAGAAEERHFGQIFTSAKVAETALLKMHRLSVVISRYSAHHRHDVGQVLREVYRV